MKNFKMIGVCGCISLLVACQQNEPLSEIQEENLDLSLQASISKPVSPARTVTEDGVTSKFSEGDRIGFFMPKANVPVEWYLEDAIWKTSTPLVWENKIDKFNFCAYYPYVETTSRTSIPMPDLGTQTGTLENIGNIDFLAARCNSSYGSNGEVSFTGEQAFKHVYSLISVVLKKDVSTKSVTLNKLTFEGTDIVSKYTYAFGDTPEEDGMQATEKETINEFSLSPSASVSNEGHTTVVLFNPSDLNKGLKYSIEYLSDGNSYTASIELMKDKLIAGNAYKFTLKLQKEGLTLVGNSVTDWNVNNKLEDIIIEENPVKE